MITLLHGDDIVSSRHELNRLIKITVNKETIRFDGNNLDQALLMQSLSSDSLFGRDILIVIENLLSSIAKKSKLSGSLTKLIQNSANDAKLILWEDKILTKNAISLIGGNINVRLFKLPVSVFQFLDGLKPNNAKMSLSLFAQSTQTHPAELIFNLLVRRIRQLIMIKDNVNPNDFPDWQRYRLTNQVKLFTMEKLLDMYQRLISLEYSFKTGATPFTFTQLIEQYIIDI